MMAEMSGVIRPDQLSPLRRTTYGPCNFETCAPRLTAPVRMATGSAVGTMNVALNALRRTLELESVAWAGGPRRRCANARLREINRRSARPIRFADQLILAAALSRG